MELLQRSRAYLEQRGVANARRECEWMFSLALGLSRLELYTRHDMLLAEPDVERLRGLVTRRGRREPLAYVLGSQPFAGVELAVAPGVLVPRPETEELVARLLADHGPEPRRVLDIGTGSGAIAIALAAARPAWVVTASDLSSPALNQARANGTRCGVTVDWRLADLLPDAGPYDLIVSNPPYIAESERAHCDPELAHEPPEALFAGADGLAVLRRLIPAAAAALAPGAPLWIEHGFRQGSAVRELATAAGLACATVTDAAGQDRFLHAWRG